MNNPSQRDLAQPQTSLGGPGPWSFVLVALLSAALCLVLWGLRDRLAFLQRLDGLSLDFQTQWRGPLAPASRDPILLVEMDEASVQALGRVVPGRTELAAVIGRLQAGGARLAAVDLMLVDRARDDAGGDEHLAAAMRAWPHVYLPFALPHETLPAQALPASSSPVGAAVLAQAFLRYEGAADAPLLSAHRLLAPLPMLADAAAGLGHVSTHRGADGALRYDLPALNLGGELYPSLAVRVAAASRHLDWRQTLVQLGQRVQMGPQGDAGLTVPIDQLSRQWVNYYGPRGSFEHVSFIDLLHGRVAQETLNGRIVLLGVTALGGGRQLSDPDGCGSSRCGAPGHGA